MLRIVVFICALVALSVQVQADQSGDQIGIVKQVPGADGDSWRIGGREVAVREDTERGLKSGGLVVGACAEVTSDGSVVSRVDSRPMSDCDTTDYDAYLASFASLAGTAPSP